MATSEAEVILQPIISNLLAMVIPMLGTWGIWRGSQGFVTGR